MAAVREGVGRDAPQGAGRVPPLVGSAVVVMSWATNTLRPSLATAVAPRIGGPDSGNRRRGVAGRRALTRRR